ncbi:353_t:CDS:2, partial [Racocetra fulgida]
NHRITGDWIRSPAGGLSRLSGLAGYGLQLCPPGYGLQLDVLKKHRYNIRYHIIDCYTKKHRYNICYRIF